jgi:multidrug efflux pump subunit AcrA (membrane-fusion protein)
VCLRQGGLINFNFNRVITEIERPREAPSAAPAPPNQPASLPAKSKRNRTGAIALATVVLVCAAGALVLWRSAASAPTSVGIRTATVVRKDFVSTLRLSGTVAAVQSISIGAPRIAGSTIEQLTITKLAPAGAKVHRGDMLVEFDQQPQIKAFLDKQAEYKDLLDQIAHKQADADAARAKDQAELQQAVDALAKAQLDIQKNEILSRIDAEKNQEALTEAEANLKQLRTTFDLKRRAAEADIHDLEVQRDRAREIMAHAEENQQRMRVVSPIDGTVVLNTIWKGGSMGRVEEGDQVYPWASFMQVVDPTAMEVRVKVNQEDVLALDPAEHATVHLDAYPDLAFPAKLVELAPVGETSEFSDKVRTFIATYRIDGSEPRLTPDLSAAVDVEVVHTAGALVVPRDSVSVDGDKAYAWVKAGTGFEKRAIKTGGESDLETVVLSGLSPNEVVLRGKA